MKPQHLGWIGAALVIVAVCLPAVNAQKRKPAAKPATAFSTQELDVNATALPANYVGNSLLDVYMTLHKRRAKWEKGEYETLEQYKARLAREQSKPILGSLLLGSRFAFSIKSIKNTYNADARNLQVVIQSTLPDQDDLNDRESGCVSLLHLDSSENKGRFIGSNSFGVRRTVTRWLNINAQVWIPELSVTEANVIDIESDTAWAKQNRDKLRVLIIGTLQAPYIGGSEDFKSATLDSPDEVKTVNVAVYLTPEAYWLYDGHTGTIHHKQSLEKKADK